MTLTITEIRNWYDNHPNEPLILIGDDLRGADLGGADLHSADLHSADLRGANLEDANLEDANLYSADLYSADLYSANLEGANLEGANLYRARGLPCQDIDHLRLRHQVADFIENHIYLHNQAAWGDGSDDPECQTPCCVAGWACHLGGGDRGLSVKTAGYLLLGGVQGYNVPTFSSYADRDEILASLRNNEI